MFYTIKDVFANHHSMQEISDRINQDSIFSDINLLGTFIDNHDNPRFLNYQGDQTLYKNALTYVLFSTGIPIIYYGTEQAFNGGNDPYCREALWPTNFNRQSTLYVFLQTIINARKKWQVYSHPQVLSYVESEFFAFYRGSAFVALSNRGSSSGPTFVVTITSHPFSNGQKICSIFTNDCPTITNNQFPATIFNGSPNIYVPATDIFDSN